MTATREAVAELVEPDRAALRLAPDKLAAVFLGMLFSRRPAAGESEPTTEDLVDVLLHGALRDPRSAA